MTHNDDGPARFKRNWLAFNENRGLRPHLLRNFIIVVVVCLLLSALLAFINGVTR